MPKCIFSNGSHYVGAHHKQVVGGDILLNKIAKKPIIKGEDVNTVSPLGSNHIVGIINGKGNKPMNGSEILSGLKFNRGSKLKKTDDLDGNIKFAF